MSHFQKYQTNVKLKTIDVNAPITIKPSRPIFTTPERSEKTPPNAVKTSGAAHNNVEEQQSLIFALSLSRYVH